MTRLTDLPAGQAKRLAELECPDFATRPWVGGPPLSNAPGRDRLLGRAGACAAKTRSAAATPITGRSRPIRAPKIC